MENPDSLREQIEAAFGHQTLYEILNVSNGASAEEIKKGYKKMALKHHPDKGGNDGLITCNSLLATRCY